MCELWHRAIDFLDHWQALSAGVLGFAAAIIVVWITLRIERRKADRELDALRKSLGVELRIMIGNAFSTYNSLISRVKNEEITYRALTYLFRVATPTIYPANADKIGLLGPDAKQRDATGLLRDLAGRHVGEVYRRLEALRAGDTPEPPI